MHTETPIVVALSGGVDSATAAAMLVEQGRRVIGVTMRLYDAGGTSASIGGRCCGPRDMEDARRVCAHLDIPFYVVDYSEEFSRRVVDDFVDSYVSGATPNPCARCNQHLKFTPLLQRARALGAAELATGHYARIEHGEHGPVLRRGVDPSKDQSYFLFYMPRDAMPSIRFPLGGLTKEQVRGRAVAYGLPNADKPDSQEICFVPDGDYAGFVEKEAARTGRSLPLAGDIVDRGGAVVGQHGGVHRFTIGQRRGLGAVGGGEPAYVVGLDVPGNRVIVGPKSALGARELAVTDVQWFGPPPAAPTRVGIQVRHRQTPLPGAVVADGAGARITLDAPAVAAPGQAAVFYQSDQILGGGWLRGQAQLSTR